MDERYRIHSNPVVDPSAVVEGDRYRISVLTDGLVRLEYAPEGRSRTGRRRSR